MDDTQSIDNSFYVKNCSLIAIATGMRASSLLELRDKLLLVNEGCIYHHFWGERMNTQFVHPQQHNDFAIWAYNRLHDHILAEKLSIIDPTEFGTLELLRSEVIETIDQRLDDYEVILWTKKEDQFNFVSSKTIIFESTYTLKKPENLPECLEIMSPSSIFYHMIDARTRTHEKIDDFSAWLKIFGEEYSDLIEQIQSIDPYFLSLRELKEELIQVVKQYFKIKKDHE